MKRMASAEKSSRSRGSLNPKRGLQLAVCIRNDEYKASLELRKIYELLPDNGAERVSHVCVKDESGEDYLYPADYFVPIKLPSSVQKAVADAR
ncbi:MAG: hypothetical protein JWO13_1471 [Acidobacteriales bacterium]|nr:hypothetical protein [Terriglobales bacterium]